MLEELKDHAIDLLKRAAQLLTGAKRRRFQAEVAQKYLGGRGTPPITQTSPNSENGVVRQRLANCRRTSNGKQTKSRSSLTWAAGVERTLIRYDRVKKTSKK